MKINFQIMTLFNTSINNNMHIVERLHENNNI